MKYVRTKDGIFEIDKLFSVEYITIGGKKYNLTSSGLNDKVIDFDKMFGCKTRQADTIEELCDYVVAMNEIYDIPYVEELPHEMGSDKTVISNAYHNVKRGQYVSWWLKLAIATDKGIIYVAKMNSKGEFELL